MISISHSQAQRLIRSALDRPAPEEQWNALQAHLEGCAACRAYRDRRLAVEKNLRRELRARWQAVGEADPDLAAALKARRRARLQQRQVLRYAGLALVLGLLLVRLVSSRGPSGAESEAGGLAVAQPQATPTAEFTPTAAPRDGLFQGVMAFEAAPGGNADIFLLEAGPGGTNLTNLTNNGARDSEPAWSPDGNWIAFLSNRDLGQGSGVASGAEIYVVSVAGTRLTRLTIDPTLSWSGPLAWSPDGRWIAATGTRRQPGTSLRDSSERWIYRVSLDGTPPRVLPYSRGATMPRFSPAQPLLAYLAEDRQLSFLRIYDARSGRTHEVLRSEAEQSGRVGPGGTVVSNFDWAPDGDTILYTSLRSIPERDPDQVHLRLVDISRRVQGLPETINTTRRSSRVLGIFPAFAPVVSASLAGFDDLLYTRSYWRGGRGPACRPLESAPRAGLSDLGLPVLCIESAIERPAWTSDGHWLALAAHTTTEEALGIYVVGLPEPGQRVLHAERLADLPAAAQALRMRPDRATAAQPIDPRSPRRVLLELPAVPPRALLSRALIAQPSSSGQNLARMREDGAGVAPIKAGQEGACPRAAPDGGEVAYTTLAQNSAQNRSDIYVMDEASGEARRITQLTNLPGPDDVRLTSPAPGQYGCPSWSPDGTHIAAWLQTGSHTFLALVPATGVQPGKPARYLPLNTDNPRVQPIWSADGRRLLLFLQPQARRGTNSGPAELSALDPLTGRVTRLASASGWSAASQAALSPDGELLAYTTLDYSPGGEMQASLRLINLQTRESKPSVRLPAYDPLETAGGFSSRGYSSREYGSLAWLDDQHLGLVFYGSPDGSVPPALLVHDLKTGGLVTLAALEEELLSAGWSPEGSWLLYSTPSGLWSLSVRGALARSSAPIWLTGEVAYEINWQ